MANDNTDYTRRQDRLVEVCRNLSANLELEPLLQAIVEAAAELTGSENSYILIYDADGACLRYIAGPWYRQKELQDLCVPLDGSAAGWVYRQSAARVIHAGSPKRLQAEINREGHNASSLLAVPLSFRGNTIGVLEALNKTSPVDYGEQDLIVLETLAAQAVIAIRNQKALEEERAAYEKLTEVDRLKSDFIALFSHELRTPLGVILGHASLICDSCSAEERDAMQSIVRSALRMREILSNFDDLNRFEKEYGRLQLKNVDMNALAQEVVNGFDDLAGEYGVEMLLNLPTAGCRMKGDADKIGLALRCVVRNAILFSNRGGKVIVRLDLVPGFVKVDVLDNGIGIPAGEQEKIFQRFYQVEKHRTRRHGGLGLGLSIAKAMIEMHGGKIWVESQEGSGSRFVMTLPVDSQQAAAAERVFID